jgi:uncharacterized protein (DUF302 family)
VSIVGILTRVVVTPSSRDYSETVSALLQAIERRALTLFARIDHAAAAHEVGLELDEEQVLLFGNPRGGTPLMQSDRRIGIELPLRMLVWRTGEDVFLGYLDPRTLAGVYDVASQHAALDQMAALLSQLAAEAAS